MLSRIIDHNWCGHIDTSKIILPAEPDNVWKADLDQREFMSHMNNDNKCILCRKRAGLLRDVMAVRRSRIIRAETSGRMKGIKRDMRLNAI